MHAQVERKTLRFGGVNILGNTFYCGVPGPSGLGGAGYPSGDEAALTASAYLPTSKASDAYQRIDLKGSIRAIGIAPDSAIHTCDIALVGRDGELERHRISPGNPLLGCRDDADFAYVSIPNALAGHAGSPTIVHWDASDIDAGDGSQIQGFPLRLEIWRGDLLPMRSDKRAGYFAHALFEIAAASSRILRVCVDGRRRVDVFAHCSTGTATITVDAVEARKAPTAVTKDVSTLQALELTDAGATSVVAAGQTISFDGNPMSVIAVNIAQTVATGIVQIKVRAWD